MYFCEKLTYQLCKYVATPKHSIPYINGKGSIPEKKANKGGGEGGKQGCEIEDMELEGVLKKKASGVSWG